MTGTVAILAAVAGILAYLVWLYNRLVRLRNLSRSSWSDIDVLLKKRHDLVGNLVETVKGYAGYEKAVLQGVTEARGPRDAGGRARASGGRRRPPSGKRSRPCSPSRKATPTSRRAKATSCCRSSSRRSKTASSTPAGITTPSSATTTTAAETFPANLFARAFGFGPAEFFQLDSPGERERTDVRLSALPLLFALLLSAAFAPGPARAEDFTIRSFRAAVEVRADASLRVVETIEAEFHRPRHGIYRDIPFRYVDELGKKTDDAGPDRLGDGRLRRRPGSTGSTGPAAWCGCGSATRSGS